MRVTIILPTYNERENIKAIIPRLYNAVPDCTVLVVDDNSPDGTADEVRQMQATYPLLQLYQRQQKEGLGKAYMDAFARVLTDPGITHIVTMDADLSHEPEKLGDMIRNAEQHDFVIGSRYVPGGQIIGWELWRKLLSAGGNFYCRTVTRLPLRDCTSGFAFIKADLLRSIDFSDFDTSGYAFLMYLKYKAWKAGATMTEVPICFRNRVTGESKISMRIVREGILLPWALLKKKNQPTLTCPLCIQKTAYFWFAKNACSVNRCMKCGLVFVSPVPAHTAPIYSQNYFCGADGGFGYVNYEDDKRSDEYTFKKYLDHIQHYRPAPGSLLDVGAATGVFVEKASQRGWQSVGVEVSPFAAEAARQKGRTVFTGTLDEQTFTPASFDVITLWDVFEHFTDPQAALIRVTNLLKPGGVLALNLPNAGSLYARLMGSRWQLIIPPEHLHLFNRINLIALLERNGYTIVENTTIGKRFTPAYIFQVLSTVKGSTWLKKLSRWLCNTWINRFSVPINVRDNMFIIARKNR